MNEKDLFLFFSFRIFYYRSKAQEAFTIKHYSINVKVNKDASLDVSETIDVHFTEPRHGIIRKIPFKYQIQKLPAEFTKAQRQLESGGYARTIVEDIKVHGWEYDVSTVGDIQMY